MLVELECLIGFHSTFLNNAIKINNIKQNDVNKMISKSDAIEEKVLLIKKGKKSYYLGIFK